MHTTLTWKHKDKITQAVAKRNYTLLFLPHLRGTNHIAGNRLYIGKAGGYSKEQDKKEAIILSSLRFWCIFTSSIWLLSSFPFRVNRLGSELLRRL